jgi:hypothetical protein
MGQEAPLQSLGVNYPLVVEGATRRYGVWNQAVGSFLPHLMLAQGGAAYFRADAGDLGARATPSDGPQFYVSGTPPTGGWIRAGGAVPLLQEDHDFTLITWVSGLTQSLGVGPVFSFTLTSHFNPDHSPMNQPPCFCVSLRIAPSSGQGSAPLLQLVLKDTQGSEENDVAYDFPIPPSIVAAGPHVWSQIALSVIVPPQPDGPNDAFYVPWCRILLNGQDIGGVDLAPWEGVHSVTLHAAHFSLGSEPLGPALSGTGGKSFQRWQLFSGRMQEASIVNMSLSPEELGPDFATVSGRPGVITSAQWSLEALVGSALGQADTDGDSFSNLSEFLQGTNPLDSTARPLPRQFAAGRMELHTKLRAF